MTSRSGTGSGSHVPADYAARPSSGPPPTTSSGASDGSPWTPRHGGPEPVRIVGPNCPSCRHGNPPQRKRCEVCGTELWPGAALPPRPMPPPPAAEPEPRSRRSWLRIVLMIGIPVVAIATVWLLAYFV